MRETWSGHLRGLPLAARRGLRLAGLCGVALAFLGPASAAAQGGPPVHRDHWSYELLEALDAAGAASGWANEVRPVARGVLRAELDRVADESLGREWIGAWAERFDAEHPAGPRAGRERGARWEIGGQLLGRTGSPFLDGGDDGVLTRLRGAWLPVERLSLWGEGNAGSDPRSAFDDGIERGGATLALGPFTWTLGRLWPEAAGPATTSTQLGGNVPVEGLHLASSRRVELPWLDWLLGPTAWQAIVAPWAGIDDTSEGWFALAAVSAEPHPRLRIGFTRSALFGGDEAGDVTAERLLRAAFFRANEPTFWDDQRMELSLRYRWPTPEGLPLATYVVVAQDDSPLWKDPGLLAGATVPLFRDWGLLSLRYEYVAHGARAAWCPFCERARGQQTHRFQGEWYAHIVHGPFRPEGVPAGSPLGGYGASHTIGGSYFHPAGSLRARAWTFFQVREDGNVLLDRWPGKRRGAGTEVSWAESRIDSPLGTGHAEVTAGLLFHEGPEIDSDWGGWLRLDLAVGGEPGARSGPPVRPAPPPALSPGDRIRVRSSALAAGRGRGVLAAVRGDTLLVELDGEAAPGAAPRAIPLESVERLRVRTGERRATLRGALVGGLTGLFGALVIVGADRADDEIDPSCGKLECYGTGFYVAMTAGGAAAGAAIGSQIRVAEWEDLPLGSGALGLGIRADRRGGVEMRVDVRPR